MPLDPIRFFINRKIMLLSVFLWTVGLFGASLSTSPVLYADAGAYQGGVFEYQDPEGFFVFRLVFEQTDYDPLPVGHQHIDEIHPTAGYEIPMEYLLLDDPFTSAVAQWELTADLTSTVSLSKSSDLWDWSYRTPVSANPFRMNIGSYYRLSFRVADPSKVSGERSIYFYFAPERMTYPPGIDAFSAYPTRIDPGKPEGVNFKCDAHDTGLWGSEWLIFRFDADGDGIYDSSDLQGSLVNTGDNEFRGVKRAEFNYPYEEIGIYAARCQVENIRGEKTISDPVYISVSTHQLGVVGFPNDNKDLGTAIIPPDDRFPALYQLTLTDRTTGTAAANQPLTISIEAEYEARLESGALSGSSIQIVTDAQGEAEFRYVFLDTPPASKPVTDEIVIEATDLGLRETAKVSVGIKPRVVDITESWGAGTSVPRTLGLRIQVVDGFRPDLDLEAWIAALKYNTGNHLGFAATTWWLNYPEPDTVQFIKDYVKGYTTPPDDEMITNARGWIKKINDQFVFQTIDSPLRLIGPHSLPVMTLHSEGMHLFELKLTPVILPEDFEDSTLTIVKSAEGDPFYFGADLYSAESTFQSFVCSFSPTDAEQFLLKSVILDCPLLTSAQWVGQWAAGTAVPHLLLVTEVSGIICDLMQGNYLNVGATLSAKYLSRLESLQESGAISLTNEELALLEKGLIANSVKRFYDTYNEAVKHYVPPENQTPSSYRIPQALPDLEKEPWPENLSLDEMTAALKALSGGMLYNPQMQGVEAIAVLSTGSVSPGQLSEETVSFPGTEVNVYLYQNETPPILVAETATELFRLYSIDGNQVAVNRYTVDIDQNSSLTFQASGDLLDIDTGGDGSVESTILPENLTFGLLPGDINLTGDVNLVDALLACQVSAGIKPAGLPVLSWQVDIDGDWKIGLSEALFAIQKEAEIP